MNMVVTNVRLPEHKYRKYKAIAAEEGVSFNEMVAQALEEKVVKKSFGGKPADFYDAFEKFIDEPYERKPMGLSEDDEIIYG